MRLIQYALMLLLTMSLNSCGFVKTAYNNAPEAINWWLDDYFDFNKAQKSILDPALQRLHDWHREHHLPIDIALLKYLQTSAGKQQISHNEACELTKRIKDNFSKLQLESIPLILEIAPLLTDKQLQYFHKKLDKRTQKWKSEWWQETSEEQIAVRYEKIEALAEKIYGDLNESQRATLKKDLLKLQINPELSYNEILRRNQDAYQIASELRNQSSSSDDKSKLVKAAFKRLRNSPNPIYQAYVDQLNAGTCEMIANLHTSTDAKQKQHAQDWFDYYIVEFTSLSAVGNN